MIHPTQQSVLARPLGQRSVDFATLHQQYPQDFPFLLESVAQGGLGRYSILMACPSAVLQLNPEQSPDTFVEAAQQAMASTQTTQLVVQLEGDESLWPPQNSALLQQEAQNLPFKGGWFAYFSYDYAQVVEPTLQLPKARFPLANLTRCHAAVICDHQTNQMWLVAEAEHAQWLERMHRQLGDLPQMSDIPKIELQQLGEEPEQKYLDGVQSIKEYILAGDVFQVNLSRLWQARLHPEHNYHHVYQALRMNNPAPFAALACLRDAQGAPWQILSSSPERLVRFDGEWVETRPIAGTRPRSLDDAADRALMAELIAHPKERAEHIMLIDLERNDLGRICQKGTVEVNELMVVESYQHVHHIVSNVRGRLAEGLNPLDIVHALFPGGTITGCPKVRCMQIVGELEQMPREAYTGSLGYINLDGTLDLNILIRSFVHVADAEQNLLQFRAGAGIVADSQPDFELTETRHKARGLLRAFAGQQNA
ncbi:MAG: aminodeoxychorismate synthase component I [Thiotrichales bacterium]|nr:aminodeoxychorismate synthase component I [Thiotrichales bacterium]